MKSLQKLFALILAITVMLCGFASCSKSTAEESTTAGHSSTEAQPTTATVQPEPTTEPASTTEPTEALTTEPAPIQTTEHPNEGPVETGAATLADLVALLEEDLLFTPRQVDCMTTEFLFACLYTADPDHAAELFEARDADAIAALLNERLFPNIGCQPVKYQIDKYQENTLTDEMRQQVQDWFMKNYSQVAAQYGEYYAQKVAEENEGREQVILLIYTATDPNGDAVSVPEDSSNALSFSVVNGRYYWNDFSLFQAIAG